MWIQKTYGRYFGNMLNEKEDISLLYANAPSYADWDNAEIEAIEEIWNENPIAVTSTKANIGFLVVQQV